jgi:ATP-binding cassette subfamily B multidrug efflux pump
MPKGFFAFLWACARGMRRYIAAMTLFTAVIGVFEALLFSMLGHVVDWLAKVQPSQLWTEQRAHLLLLAGVLAGSTCLIATAESSQAAGARRQFRHAAALGLPPQHARAEP